MADMIKQAMDALKAMKDQNINFDDLIPKDTYALVRSIIANLGQQAWICLGMQQNPFTQKIEKDLVQAKLAIDCVSSLCDLMKPHSNQRELLEMEALKQNLQMNYINQSNNN